MLKLSKILTWINMVVAGGLTLAGVLSILAAPGAIASLIGVLLIGTIVLHSYAALQLRKSLLNPEIPLDSRTPTGIRFIGFLALFFAIICLLASFGMIGSPAELLQEAVMPPEVQEMVTVSFIRNIGYFMLIFGLSVAVNVNINFILLRNYLFNQKNKDNN